MEKLITHNYSPNTKNIRIRTQSKSQSKGKLKLSLKTHNQQSKNNISHETQNVSLTEYPSTFLSFQKGKIDQKQRRTSIFFPNKEKKCLIISNKENIMSKPTNLQNPKLQNQYNLQEMAGLTHKLSLIQMFQQRQLKQVQQDELPTPRDLCKKNQEIKSKYNKNKESFLNSKQFSSQQFQKNFLSYKKQCQKMLTEKSLCHFKISNQFSLTLGKKCNKKDCQTQTENFSSQDKYFVQYQKYRQLKEKGVNGFDAQQEKINKILSNNEACQQNYEQLMESILTGPEGDRQKRVFNLTQDLQKQRSFIGERLKKINDLSVKFQDKVEQNMYEIMGKKALLLTSITHLVDASIVISSRQRRNDNQKLTRILQRIKKQSSFLRKFALQTRNYGISMLKDYSIQFSNLHKDYEAFKQSQLENRVILYNCVKQIEKLPTLMVMLFGFDKQPEICERFKGHEKIQCRFSEYMSVKCQECFHTKKKIKLIQFHNDKIKPVFKSLNWLLEDKSKPSCCLSII